MSAPWSVRPLCGTCLKNGFKRSTCAYCDAALSPRHEHDHMPIPARAGGDKVVPVCVNCHDLKDRTNPAEWDQQVFRESLEGAPPLVRILIAKLLADLHDLRAGEDAEERAA